MIPGLESVIGTHSPASPVKCGAAVEFGWRHHVQERLKAKIERESESVFLPLA